MDKGLRAQPLTTTRYFPLAGAALPRPPPEMLPVVLGQLPPGKPFAGCPPLPAPPLALPAPVLLPPLPPELEPLLMTFSNVN